MCNASHVKLLLSLLLGFASQAFSFEVMGANQTLSLNPSTRSAGSGNVQEAVQGTSLGMALHPLGMLDLYDWQFGLSHTAHYEGTTLDAASMVYPLNEKMRVGVLFSRFGATDIPWIREGEPLPVDGEWETLSIADYQLSFAFSRKLPWNLDAAAVLHTLYRKLDQDGYGVRLDASLRWISTLGLELGGHLIAASSSAATWESGYFEYSLPEVYSYLAYQKSMPYVYGSLRLAYRSAGMARGDNRSFQATDAWLSDSSLSTSEDSLAGLAWWDSPVDWLRDGSLGMEWAMDWGGSLRLGWQSLSEWNSWTMGAGFLLYGWLQVDYAFERHPRLSGVHRIGLELKPWWRSKTPVVSKEKPKRQDVLKPDLQKQNSEEVELKQPTAGSQDTLRHVEDEGATQVWEE